MYEPHELLSLPDDSQVIWRYFSFPSFLSLILNNELYFRRCDKFDDQWDSRHSILPLLLRQNIAPEEQKTSAIRVVLSEQEDLRSTTFASCWYKDDQESAAMWEIYTARSSGIAIQSTVGSLKAAFQSWKRRVWISSVEYRDLEDIPPSVLNNSLVPFFFKRLEFKYEQELRVLVPMRFSFGTISDFEPVVDDNAAGFSAKFEVGKLIHSVIVAPRLPATIVGIIRKLLDQVGLNQIPCRHSRLAEKPTALRDFDHMHPKIYTVTMRAGPELLELLCKAVEEFHRCFYLCNLPIPAVEAKNLVYGSLHAAGYFNQEAED